MASSCQESVNVKHVFYMTEISADVQNDSH